MDELRALARFVTDNRRKPDSQKAWRYNEAIDYLRSSRMLTDEGLAEMLQMNPGETRFRMFKSRLRKKLLNSMLASELPEKFQTAINDAIMHCSVLQYATRFLLYSWNRSIMVPLAKEGLEKALKFSLTEFVIFFSRILRTNAGITGDDQAFEHYNRICSNAIATYLAEDEANVLNETLTREHSRSTIYPRKLIKTGETFYKRVEKLKAKYDSFNLNLSCYRLGGQLSYIKQDYQSALNNWIGLETYLGSYNNADYWVGKGEALIQQLKCRLYLRQYMEAESSIHEIEKIVRPGSPHWLTILELKFLLAMHNKNYSEAKLVYRELFESSNTSRLNETEAERWELFSVYLAFIDTFLETKGGEVKQINRKKVKDLLNNLPEQSKDKQGYNVSILLIQILWRLAEHDYSGAIDRIGALNSYANRYLKGDEYSRSFLFVKMLSALDKADFDLKKADKTIAPLYRELQKLSEGTGGKLIDGMEVILYPHLWEIVVSILERDSR
jgi:hypothetical protein